MRPFVLALCSSLRGISRHDAKSEPVLYAKLIFDLLPSSSTVCVTDQRVDRFFPGTPPCRLHQVANDNLCLNLQAAYDLTTDEYDEVRGPTGGEWSNSRTLWLVACLSAL